MAADPGAVTSEQAVDEAAAIDARGLTKIYRPQGGQPEKLALDGVDLRVPVGSIFGLLGPNGAGKSTFINILAGLVRKTSGSVTIWGFDQDVNPRNSRASIGVVPQELTIDPFLNPHEALEVQAGLYGVPASRRRTTELLGALGLGDKARAYARTLSGGMRRRLLVAKAMAHDPPVLVLDEPTAGVDLELRRQLWGYVRQLNARGTTIILTTHYLEEAEEMCDRIAIINKGRVAVEAATDQLLDMIDRRTTVVQPARAIEDLSALRAALPPKASVAAQPDGALSVTHPKKNGGMAAVLAALSAAGVEIADLQTQDADLEDVFLELTRDR